MTATEALRQCIEAMKLVDFKDCGESEALWHQFNMAQANAELVLRDNPAPSLQAVVDQPHAASPGDAIREKFEEWARYNCPFLPNLKGTISGKQFVYFDIEAQRLWSAFSAALSAAGVKLDHG